MRALRASHPDVFEGSRALLDSATSTKGAELVLTGPGPDPIIEVLRATSLVAKFGATILAGLDGPVAWPRQTATATAAWVPESPTADVGSSNLLLDQVQLTAKPITSTTSYSRKLLLQAARSIEAAVAADFVAGFGTAIDIAAIAGPGTSNQPTGILSTAGIGSVTLGANGGLPVYDTFVDLENQLGAANADRGSLAFLTTSKVRQRMRKSSAISAATGIPVWAQGMVCDYPAGVSSNVPANLTKGTSTICHAIIFGNFQDIVLAQWGAIDILADPFAQKRRADIEVTAYAMFDIAVRHAASFAACKDALP